MHGFLHIPVGPRGIRAARHAVAAIFQQVAKDAFEDLMNENWKFYKKVSDDQEVAKELFARLLERYVDGYTKSRVLKSTDQKT